MRLPSFKSKINTAYYLHSFFFRYSEATMFIFGAFFIVQKTGSVLLTLSGYLINGLILFSLRSWAVSVFLFLLRALGPRRTAILGLTLEAIALSIFAALPLTGLTLTVGFVLKACGSVFYITTFHAALYSDIGKTGRSGIHTAHMSALVAATSLLAAVLTSVMALYSLFPWAIALAAASYFFAGYSLRFIEFPVLQEPDINFHKIIRSISAWCYLGNIVPTAQFWRIGVPIVMYGLFTANTTIIIIGLVPVIEIIFSYISGISKDMKERRPVIVFSGVLISSWFAYVFTQTPFHFTLNNAVNKISGKAVATAVDAKTADEVAITDPLIATLSFESARGLGSTLGIAVLLAIYFYFGTIPAWTMALGALFIIPRIIYVTRR